MEYAITSLIGITTLSYETPPAFATSVHAIIFAVVTQIIPVASLAFILSYGTYLESQTVKENFGALYIHLKPSSKARILYPIFLLRRQLMCIALVSLQDSRIAQLQILILISVFYLAYLVAVRPYISNLFNFFEILNETIILGCMYHLMIFTDFVQVQETLYKAGWSLICLVLLMFISNAILIFCVLFHHIRRLCIVMKVYIKRICLRPKFKINEKLMELQILIQIVQLHGRQRESKSGMYFRLF